MVSCRGDTGEFGLACCALLSLGTKRFRERVVFLLECFMVREESPPFGSKGCFFFCRLLRKRAALLLCGRTLLFFGGQFIGEPHAFMRLLLCLFGNVPDHLPEILLGPCFLLQDGFDFHFSRFRPVLLPGEGTFKLIDLDGPGTQCFLRFILLVCKLSNLCLQYRPVPGDVREFFFCLFQILLCLFKMLVQGFCVTAEGMFEFILLSPERMHRIFCFSKPGAG